MKYDLNNLTQQQIEKLRNEVVLCSLYTSDFENSFGIPAGICQTFFDGYAEELGYIMEEDNIDDDAFFENLQVYDNTENLYEYYCSCEYPFGKDLYYKCIEAPVDWMDEHQEEEEDF